ncbi:MAG: ankyrin repeat domain-containing protein, partial [Armatimonadetes bacterium]|nr:ankyrin repeat domain-containing protein [Armatimonadota bacterium]
MKTMALSFEYDQLDLACFPQTPEGGMADVSARDQSGRSLLDVAASRGDLEAVKRLLDHGAAVDVPSSRGHFPLWFALERGHLELAEMLLARARHSLCSAAAIGDSAGLRRLLGPGADVSTGTEEPGGKSLFCAAPAGQVAAVRLLLERGVEIGRHDASETPLLCCAARDGNAEMAELLLEAGADIKAM